MFSRPLSQILRGCAVRKHVTVLSEIRGSSPLAPLPLMRGMASSVGYEFETLNVTTPGEFIKHVELNRPKKMNAMNTTFWSEIITCFKKLASDPDCRVVVLSGAGKMFTAGLDFMDNEKMMTLLMAGEDTDPGRHAFVLGRGIPDLQESCSVLESCNKPVISAIHDGCIGAGIDLTSAADIRYCTEDAWFQIKEVDLGLAADLGTLQRFPKIIGNDSLCRELVYTGRKFHAEEAKGMGFVSRTFPDKASMMTSTLELAKVIASKSPVAVQGSKVNLVYSRDHSVKDGLDYIVNWNSAMLQSDDTKKAVMSLITKETPEFDKL